MQFLDLCIRLEGLATTKVRCFGADTVQVTLGDGRLDNVIVEMSRMQAGALALQLTQAVPEQSRPSGPAITDSGSDQADGGDAA